ncbi:MAG: PASTA domain-containing protein [Bacteroidaceae bacterium]|nr:PASTA domain-containing protein [Bacteroidaceae bacterium]
MSEVNKEDKSVVRFRILTILMSVVALFIIVQMCRVMFAERRYWKEVSNYMVSWNKTIEPRRGNILSDEGLLMASSMPQYRIYLDFVTSERVAKLKDSDQNRKDTLFYKSLDETVSAMHNLFPSIPQSRFREHYVRGHSIKSKYYPLVPDGKVLSYNQFKEAVVTVPWLKPRYEGWFYSKDGRVSRKKPFGQLATRTLGDLYGAKDSARYGLEFSFDSVLRGTPGIGHEERIRNTTRVIVDKEQTDGSDIVTTLNVQMQDIAETALRRRLLDLNSYSGVAVLMDVATGDIKAMASLTRTGDGSYYEIQNNVVKEIYEPGSTFKTVSMMVALDAGKMSINDSVYCEKGQYFGFGGVRMTDSHGLGWATAAEVLMESSNIGTAKLISKAFKGHEEEFVEGVYKTGINTHFDLQLTGTAAPVIRKGGYWDATRLPWMSYGYNVQLPAINTLAFYNGIANGGKMVAPRLVTEVRRDGQVVKSFPVVTVTERMCGDSTLKDIRYMLEKVVEEGTGKQAGSSRFKVAGKTGTAQLSQGAGGYTASGRSYLASFCGYFPADNPRFSCIVTIRTQKGQLAYGAGAAGPVFHEISEKVMSMLGESNLADARDTVNSHVPTVLSGDMSKAGYILSKLGITAYPKDGSELADSLWGKVTNENDSIVITPREYRNGLVPDVVGMGASDAVYLLESVGLKVGLSGVGRVYSQSLSAGTAFKQGSYILIKLRM